MRIALDAMGGDHAPGPDRRRGGPGRRRRPRTAPSSSSATRPRSSRSSPADGPRDRLELFHAAEVVGMDESPVEALRTSRTTPSAAAGSSWSARRSTPSSAPATPGRWSPAACCPRRFLKDVRRPGHRRRHADRQGAVRHDRRRRQRPPQAGAPLPVRRHGRDLRQAHPARRTRPSA